MSKLVAVHRAKLLVDGITDESVCSRIAQECRCYGRKSSRGRSSARFQVEPKKARRAPDAKLPLTWQLQDGYSWVVLLRAVELSCLDGVLRAMSIDSSLSLHPVSAIEVSIVTPCYNEQEVLRAFYERTTAACRPFGRYEIVLVDDGSSDETWSIIHDLASHDPKVIGIRLSRNHGHQLALSAGLAHANGARIMIIDADLQDPPELLREMMDLMDGGADVVYGQRRHRKGESAFKLATAHLFYRCLRALSDTPIPEDTGDFRLMSRRVLETFNTMPEQQRFIRGMISWLGFRQVPLLYDRDERAGGSSKYPFRKMARFAADAVTSFSTRPLRLASYLGLTVGVLCLVAIVYLVVGHYVGYTVPGWTSLIAVVLLVGALQLFVLGIIGEYLGRLFIESKGRPLYVVAEIAESSPEVPS